MRLFPFSVLSIALLMPSGASADYITTFVPGFSDPWLAGMPTNARASGYTPGSLGVDTAPPTRPCKSRASRLAAARS